MTGLARIGRDPELRFTSGNGTPVLGLSLAFSYGKKGDDGKKPTQWVDATLWGQRAESLEPYLKKGALVVAHLEEVHIETYQRRDGGEGHKLVAKVTDIELVPSGQREEGRPAAAPRPAARPAPAPAGGSGFEDMDDDIPF